MQILDAETVKRDYVSDQEAAGAMHEPEGIGIHAGKDWRLVILRVRERTA